MRASNRRGSVGESGVRALTAMSLRSPAAVAVGVAVTILFGVFALSTLPIQLFPDIERPQIGIQTGWRTAKSCATKSTASANRARRRGTRTRKRSARFSKRRSS